MEHRRPLALSIMGECCFVFAGIWFVWLVLGHRVDFVHLFAVSTGNREWLSDLALDGLTRADPIRFTFVMFALQLALVGVLVWTGCALMRSWPSARWCPWAFSVFAVTVAVFDTIERLFFLTLPHEVVKVNPFVLDAAVILFAINLCAATFLPSVSAAISNDKDLIGKSQQSLSG